MLKFKVDPERITLGELIDAQEGKLAAMRDMLAHCLVDDAGDYVETEAAMRMVSGLKLSEVKDTVDGFVNQLQGQAVNPPSGGS